MTNRNDHHRQPHQHHQQQHDRISAAIQPQKQKYNYHPATEKKQQLIYFSFPIFIRIRLRRYREIKMACYTYL